MAVYTPIDDATVERVVAAYGLGDVVRWYGIQEGVENSNFFIETATRRAILTLYEKRVNPADLPFFLGIMDHLAARGVPCPVPFADGAGERLCQVRGRPAACVSFLDGRSAQTITAAHCAALGTALARLHLAGLDYPHARRVNDLALGGWRRLGQSIGGRADEIVPGLQAEIATELAWLGERWPKELPAGIIHGDLFPDNVFFIDGEVSGLIDFYFACGDSLAYDLAICINAWCFGTDGTFEPAKAKALVRGYVEIRPLATDEIRSLPLLCRGAALRFLLTRLFDWLHHVEGALVVPKDPREYLDKNRFHRDVERPSVYGFE